MKKERETCWYEQKKMVTKKKQKTIISHLTSLTCQLWFQGDMKPEADTLQDLQDLQVDLCGM